MSEKTIVLNIPILEDEERNEYSYLDLVEAHLNSKSNSQILTDNNDSKLEDLAKALEKKYGQMLTINKKGKKKRVRVDDFIDHGEGYDSQDSFIDDSEAIELVVAPTLSTKYGGFFINEGALDSIEDNSMNIEMPPEIQKKVDTKKDKRHSLKKDKSKQLLERAVKRLSSPAIAVVGQKSNLHTLDSTFDAVLAQHSDEPKVHINGIPPVNIPSTDTSLVPAVNKLPAPKLKVVGPCVLPRLPESLLSSVQHILTFKPTTPTTGKWSLPPLFDNELLRFDDQIIDAHLHKSVRSGVYAYLEEAFSFKRKSLMTRLRKLREVKNESKLEPMLVSLKNAVSKVMPDILIAHKRDMTNYQERLSTWEIDKASNSELKRPGAPKKIFKWTNDCRILIDRIVACRMETAFAAMGKCVDEEQMKRFLNTLIPLWPDNWISIAALWRASLPTYQRVKSKLVPNAPVSIIQTNSIKTACSQSPSKSTTPITESAKVSKPLAPQTSIVSNRNITPNFNMHYPNNVSTAAVNAFTSQFVKTASTLASSPTIDLTSDVDLPTIKTSSQKSQLPSVSSFSPPSIASVVRSPLSVSIPSPLITPVAPQERRGSVASMDMSGYYAPNTPIMGNSGRNSIVRSTSSASKTIHSPSSSSASPSTVVMQQLAKATGVPMATVAALGSSPGSIQAMIALYQQQQQHQQQQQQQTQQLQTQHGQRNRLSQQQCQQQKQQQPFSSRVQNNNNNQQPQQQKQRQQQQQQQQVSAQVLSNNNPLQHVSVHGWSPQQIQALRAVLAQQQKQPITAAVSNASASTSSPSNNSNPSYQTNSVQFRQAQQQTMQHQQMNQTHYQNIRRLQLQPNMQTNASKDVHGSINRNGK